MKFVTKFSARSAVKEIERIILVQNMRSTFLLCSKSCSGEEMTEISYSLPKGGLFEAKNLHLDISFQIVK